MYILSRILSPILLKQRLISSFQRCQDVKKPLYHLLSQIENLFSPSVLHKLCTGTTTISYFIKPATLFNSTSWLDINYFSGYNTYLYSHALKIAILPSCAMDRLLPTTPSGIIPLDYLSSPVGGMKAKYVYSLVLKHPAKKYSGTLGEAAAKISAHEYKYLKDGQLIIN